MKIFILLSCVVISILAAKSKRCGCGGGGEGGKVLGKTKEPNTHIIGLANELRYEMAQYIGVSDFTHFRVVSYRPHYLGAHYFAKIQVGTNQFIHVKMQAEKTATSTIKHVVHVQTGMSMNDPIAYF